MALKIKLAALESGAAWMNTRRGCPPAIPRAHGGLSRLVAYERRAEAARIHDVGPSARAHRIRPPLSNDSHFMMMLNKEEIWG